MARPVHFEMHAEDPQRAIALYSRLLGGGHQGGRPDGGWLACGKDPEGNLFGMMQMDDKAA